VTSSLLSPSSPSGSQADALLQRRAQQARADAYGAGGAVANGERGVPTLLCASGRGGSGTTLLSALLAVSAAGDGYRVLLIDADEHVGPLSMLLGVTARASWQDLRGGRVSPVQAATPISTTLTLMAGGAARLAPAGGVTITAAERRACLRRVSVLAQGMDLVVIDCGARFDTVAAAITPHADERLLAVAAGADPIGLAATYALCKAVHARHGALPLDVLVNRHEGSEAIRCFDAIDAGARQFLGTSLRFAGAIPTDPTLDAALRAGMPFPDAAAGSPAAIAAHEAVMRTLAGTSPTRPGV
jgi:MinD-like ATPase involved in chromosome partitioning or flagellar assembly